MEEATPLDVYEQNEALRREVLRLECRCAWLEGRRPQAGEVEPTGEAAVGAGGLLSAQPPADRPGEADPVDDRDRLRALVDEHSARLAHVTDALRADLEERRRTEELLSRRDAIMEAVEVAVEGILSPDNWDATARDVLEALGRATEVGRAAVFENHHGPGGELLTGVRHEWVAPGAQAQADDPDLQDFDYEAVGFARWVTVMGSGRPICGCVRDLPEPEAAVLASRGVLAVAAVPIHVSREFWGYLGLEDFAAARTWPPGEVAGLRAVAALLGAAIERELVDEERTRQSADLSRANGELDRLAYVASHDLKEPLRTIASFAQLLSRRYQGRLDAEADEFIGYVVSGAKRMEELIGDLLAYTRAGGTDRPLMPCDCDNALRKALADLTGVIEAASAAVTYQRLPTVLADYPQIVQLFRNLISNAIKFRGEDPPCIQVAARREGFAWLISVQDNGIGIAPEYFDRIFVAFQRLHTHQEYPGTGVGLAVCRKIVQRHGGDIWVESAPGAGSTFHFTIPDCPEPIIEDDSLDEDGDAKEVEQ
jgi:signal transduction histidine kinase